MDIIRHYDSPLGGITLSCDGAALTGLWFDGQAHFGKGLDTAHEAGDAPALDEAARWLDMYFAGLQPGFTPVLAPRGTAFQRAVWDALLTLPYGETTTYGRLAARLGTASARAVGGAVARNPISLIIPCHRVIGADGSLTGYAGGIGIKRALLTLEGFLPREGEEE